MSVAQQEHVAVGFAASPERARPALRTVIATAHPVSVVTSRDAFAALEPAWRELESAAPPPSVFQSFDWLAAWAATHVDERTPSPLCVLTGFRDQRLVFAWPLMRTEVGPMTILRWMSEPLAQYGDILLAPGEPAEHWMSNAMRHLQAMGGIDAIRLRHVRADAAATPTLQQTFRDACMSDEAPWLDLTAFTDGVAYEGRYTSSQRKRRKKIRKALEDEFGSVTFELLENGEACEAAIIAAVAEKRQWLMDRGRQNRALCPVYTVAMLKTLCQHGNGRLRLVVSRMLAGDRPVSWEIGLRFGQTHFGFITSHVNSLTDFSPGRLHMDYSQRQALADGMTAFDLMVPNDAHKESWSSARMETRDYHLPLTALGRLYGIGYLETARPLLRRTYYRMPQRVLKLIRPITGH